MKSSDPHLDEGAALPTGDRLADSGAKAAKYDAQGALIDTARDTGDPINAVYAATEQTLGYCLANDRERLERHQALRIFANVLEDLGAVEIGHQIYAALERDLRKDGHDEMVMTPLNDPDSVYRKLMESGAYDLRKTVMHGQMTPEEMKAAGFVVIKQRYNAYDFAPLTPQNLRSLEEQIKPPQAFGLDPDRAQFYSKRELIDPPRPLTTGQVRGMEDLVPSLWRDEHVVDADTAPKESAVRVRLPSRQERRSLPGASMRILGRGKSAVLTIAGRLMESAFLADTNYTFEEHDAFYRHANRWTNRKLRLLPDGEFIFELPYSEAEIINDEPQR